VGHQRPFVFFIELGWPREDGSTHYPLDAARWAKVIDGISRCTGEVFLEGEEPLDHPEAASILETLDGTHMDADSQEDPS
jgi:hypothetical protein